MEEDRFENLMTESTITEVENGETITVLNKINEKVIIKKAK